MSGSLETKAIGAGLIVALVFAVLAWHHVRPWPWTWPILLALVPVAVASKNLPTIHLTTLAALTTVVPRLFPTFPSLFVAKGTILATYAALCLVIPPLRREGLSWWKVGEISGRAWLVAATCLLGFIGFTAWYLTRQRPPAVHSLVAGADNSVLLFIIVAVAINALFEEIFWRGAMQTALESVGVGACLAILLQAIHFGLAHYRPVFFGGGKGCLP